MQNDVTQNILMYFVLPVWLVAGCADWFCHRASHIERTTGAKESLIHLLMFAEVGLPLLGGICLQINATVIALMLVAFFVHEATALWDVSYAVTARIVTPWEQHIHSFLEMIPLMAMVAVFSLHWPQFLAVFGLGVELADFTLRLKGQPLPTAYVATILACIVIFELLPYAEELVRGWSANRGRLVPLAAREAEAAGRRVWPFGQLPIKGKSAEIDGPARAS